MEFSLPIRVYIEDTDAGGIVYYVNYLKFCERARTEYMRGLGFDKAAFLGDDLMFVVTHADIAYKASARLDDQLIATAEVVKVGGATLTFKQQVRRDDALLIDATIEIATVSRESGRAKRLPKEIVNAVASAGA